MAKFCKFCGKTLEEGELCTCEASKAAGVAAQGQQPGQYQQEIPQYQQQATAQYQQPGQYQQAAGQYQQTGQYQQAAGQQQAGQYQQQAGQYQQQQAAGQYQQNPYQQQYRQRQPHMAGEDFVGELKGLFVSPTNTIKQMAMNPGQWMGMILIGAKMIAALIFALVLILKTKSALGFVSDYFQMPTGKIIFLALALSVGASFAQAGLFFAAVQIFHGRTTFRAMTAAVGSGCLIETCTLLLGTLIFLALPAFGICIMILGTLMAMYVEYRSFSLTVQINPDLLTYVFYIAKAVVVIIFALIVYFTAKSMVTSIIDSISGLASGLSSFY